MKKKNYLKIKLILSFPKNQKILFRHKNCFDNRNFYSVRFFKTKIRLWFTKVLNLSKKDEREEKYEVDTL